MIYVVNDNNSCFFNHAAEEYLMEKFDEEVFMLWINEPSILIGKNQNPMAEVNYDYIRENNIQLVRRLSGGGTVYNDHGNINFTFITTREDKKEKLSQGFEKFAMPVVNALRSLGVEAEFSGRNDITVKAKKISGNAQYCQRDKLLHHGTILFDCDMSKLSLALKSRPIKFKDKGVKSVGSRVTNILEHLDQPMSLEEFKEYLKDYIINSHEIKTIYEFTREDIGEIEEIAKGRFNTWQWNYGKTPKYTYSNEVKYPCGLVEYNLNIKNGFIQQISINGDFFGDKQIEKLESLLIASKFNREDIEGILLKIDIGDYIKGLSNREFVQGLLDI